MFDAWIAVGLFLLLPFVGWLVWPERGLVARWQAGQQRTQRVRREDALKQIHKCEMQGRTPTVESIAGALHLGLNETAQLVTETSEAGLLQVEQGKIRLTPEGRESALHIIRAHRLWERYLAEETGFDEEEWHGQAERWEHELTPAGVTALAARLGNPTHDPHGDPIPTAEGEMVLHAEQSLAEVALDSLVRVVHLEDEPEVVYAQLVAAGIYPGMVVRVVESSPQRVRFLSRGNEHVLAPIVAGNVSVEPLTAADDMPANGSFPLVEVELGDEAEVVRLSPAARGVERRRLMDLGILPGTIIRSELRSPGGDPTAYRIRGALIALREEQARMIQVREVEQEATTRSSV